jgi:zinc metalloprotease ZmpA
MQLQSRLLTFAIASAIAATAAPAVAGNAFNTSVALRAQGLVNGPAALAVRRASADGFIVRDVIVDAKGTEHVRFDRTYRGLPVIGGDLVVHSRNGQFRSASETLKTTVRPDVVPTFSSSRAIIEAGARFGSGFIGKPTSRLVVYALGGTKLVLAHEVVFSGMKADQTPTDMHYFVDARSGRILNQWDTVETAVPGPGGTSSCTPVAAVGSGKSLTEGTISTLNTVKCGTQYQLKDLTRGGGYTTNMAQRTSGSGSVYLDADNAWGTGTLTNAATVAVDAHYGVAKTWDYYVNVHSRHGIANDGKGALSRVHYGRSYNNAFWSDACFCMTFGDGDNGVTTNPLIALDVAGHEMSHGVTARTSGLNYVNESGGLNEANSDIMGTMVEFYAQNPNDPGDYLIGEKVYAHNTSGTKALRFMFKPSLDGISPDCYTSDIGGLNVHYSSGIANHFYYLLAEGAVVPTGFGTGTPTHLTAADLVCNGNTAIVGIGRTKAEQIWYTGMTQYMTSNTDYAGARAATLSAASDLYGSTSAEYNAVVAAWDAVSVVGGPI